MRESSEKAIPRLIDTMRVWAENEYGDILDARGVSGFEIGSCVQVSDGLELIWVDETDGSGVRVVGFAVVDALDDAEVIHRVIFAGGPADPERTFVLIEIGPNLPVDQRGADLIPSYVDTILREGECDDYGVSVTSRPRVLSSAAVPGLIDTISGHDHSIMVIVAGTSVHLPRGRWRDFIGDLLAPARGMCAVYVLDPGATDVFNSLVEPGHGIPQGAIRMFSPGARPRDPGDPAPRRLVSAVELADDASRRDAVQDLVDDAVRYALAQGAGLRERRYLKTFDRYLDELVLATRVDVHDSALAYMENRRGVLNGAPHASLGRSLPVSAEEHHPALVVRTGTCVSAQERLEIRFSVLEDQIVLKDREIADLRGQLETRQTDGETIAGLRERVNDLSFQLARTREAVASAWVREQRLKEEITRLEAVVASAGTLPLSESVSTEAEGIDSARSAAVAGSAVPRPAPGGVPQAPRPTSDSDIRMLTASVSDAKSAKARRRKAGRGRSTHVHGPVRRRAPIKPGATATFVTSRWDLEQERVERPNVSTIEMIRSSRASQDKRTAERHQAEPPERSRGDTVTIDAVEEGSTRTFVPSVLRTKPSRYEIARPRPGDPVSLDLVDRGDEAANALMLSTVREIVKVEAPISPAMLTRKLVHSYGRRTDGEREVRRLLSMIVAAQSVQVDEFGFIWGVGTLRAERLVLVRSARTSVPRGAVALRDVHPHELSLIVASLLRETPHMTEGHLLEKVRWSVSRQRYREFKSDLETLRSARALAGAPLPPLLLRVVGPEKRSRPAGAPRASARAGGAGTGLGTVADRLGARADEILELFR